MPQGQNNPFYQQDQTALADWQNQFSQSPQFQALAPQQQSLWEMQNYQEVMNDPRRFGITNAQSPGHGQFSQTIWDDITHAPAAGQPNIDTGNFSQSALGGPFLGWTAPQFKNGQLVAGTGDFYNPGTGAVTGANGQAVQGAQWQNNAQQGTGASTAGTGGYNTGQVLVNGQAPGSSAFNGQIGPSVGGSTPGPSPTPGPITSDPTPGNGTYKAGQVPPWLSSSVLNQQSGPQGPAGSYSTNWTQSPDWTQPSQNNNSSNMFGGGVYNPQTMG